MTTAKNLRPHQHRPLVSHSCMIIPVFFGIWWFYFRRKASQVFRKLMVKNTPQDDRRKRDIADEEFSTWEEVMDQNSNDPSIRFVRWIKTRDLSQPPARQRNKVKQVTRNTMRKAELATPMMDVIVDEEGSGSVASEVDKWQCLKEVGMDGIELCSMGSPISFDEGSLLSSSVLSVA